MAWWPRPGRLNGTVQPPPTASTGKIIMKFKTKHQGIQLLSVRESTERSLSLSTPRMVRDYMVAEAKADREIFWVLHLNAKNRIIHKEMAAMGSTMKCGIEVKSIMRKAVVSGSVSIITVHNHPSGDLTPSPNDLELWTSLGLAGDLLGIQVLDNMIISADGYYSQKEQEEKQGKGRK